MQRGQYRYISDSKKYTNRVHRDDIVEILRLALGYKKSLPASLNISDDSPAIMSEVADYYVQKFNLPTPQSITREEALISNRLRLLQSQRVSNALVKEVLNYEFLYPSYREGAGCEFVNL